MKLVGGVRLMTERPRILLLDLLESFVRERDVNVRLERSRERHAWVCTVTNGLPAGAVEATGDSAREAIKTALEKAGVELPG
jgi:hypothetical protein